VDIKTILNNLKRKKNRIQITNWGANNGVKDLHKYDYGNCRNGMKNICREKR